MIRDLNKIFELWKDKVGSKRTPNPKSAEHQYQLREILNDFNWDEEVITELLYNLSEEEKEEKPNPWPTKAGNWRGERPDGTKKSYDDKNKTIKWISGEDPDEEEWTPDSEKPALSKVSASVPIDKSSDIKMS